MEGQKPGNQLSFSLRWCDWWLLVGGVGKWLWLGGRRAAKAGPWGGAGPGPPLGVLPAGLPASGLFCFVMTLLSCNSLTIHPLNVHSFERLVQLSSQFSEPFHQITKEVYPLALFLFSSPLSNH